MYFLLNRHNGQTLIVNNDKINTVEDLTAYVEKALRYPSEWTYNGKQLTTLMYCVKPGYVECHETTTATA